LRGGFGWEAGIRTPITCSRGRCPTVGRPPSASRGAEAARTSDYSRSKRGSANTATSTGKRNALLSATRRSLSSSGRRQDCSRLWTLPPAAVVAAVSGDDSPSRPCVRPHALPHSSTRVPYPFDAQPCRPYLQYLAACFYPSMQIRDLLLPPFPLPTQRRSGPGSGSFGRVLERTRLQPMCHDSPVNLSNIST
jgi:hypothetical protein